MIIGIIHLNQLKISYSMVICLCNQVTEEKLQAAIAKGITSPEALRESLGIGANCGCCAEAARDYINRHCPATPCEHCPRRAASAH